MKEELLHFVWKLQLFANQYLKSTLGDEIQIVSAGFQNFNSGPDFLNAKIRVGQQLWAGNVEIHLKSSDWYLHKHEKDENYHSVILHVVWEDDVEVFRNSNEAIQTLELKNYISKKLLQKYQSLFNIPKKWINCENDITDISAFSLNHFFEQLYFERLEQKSLLIQKELTNSNNNWEAVLYKLLLKNFGLKVNGEAFYNLSNSVDFSIIRKLSANAFQLEALLFGQAGLLSGNRESKYFDKLKKEYSYLQSKFKLKPLNQGQIQFFHLRPNNFPTIRLSQVVQLYVNDATIFSKILEYNQLEEFYDLFSVKTSEFWETHYTFEKESKKRVKKLTNSFIDLLLVNTIIPIKFLYLNELGKPTDAVLELIRQIKPEKNSIVSKFNNLKIKSHSAFETQALLQMKNEYCNKLNCLNCKIGMELLTS
jgi:hypothetical protein